MVLAGFNPVMAQDGITSVFASNVDLPIRGLGQAGEWEHRVLENDNMGRHAWNRRNDVHRQMFWVVQWYAGANSWCLPIRVLELR